MKYKIYKLILNEQVVYVGQTTLSLERRKRGPYRSIDKDIIKLSKIELIEDTDDVSRERYWIKYYIELGYKLYNKENGSGYKGSIESKEFEYRRSKSEIRKNYKREYTRSEKYKEYRRKKYADNKLKIINEKEI
jgi:hypothetical protein